MTCAMLLTSNAKGNRKKTKFIYYRASLRLSDVVFGVLKRTSTEMRFLPGQYHLSSRTAYL